jgi:hypothetical protein
LCPAVPIPDLLDVCARQLANGGSAAEGVNHLFGCLAAGHPTPVLIFRDIAVSAISGPDVKIGPDRNYLEIADTWFGKIANDCRKSCEQVELIMYPSELKPV